QNMHYIKSPGTLDGGDVLQADNTFYIGISDRTNKEGARQLKAILENYSYQAHIVTLQDFYHLKTGVAYLGDQIIVVACEFMNHHLFAAYEKIVIDKPEMYAANCIKVNNFVIMPKGYPEANRKLERAGFQTIPLDMSEFQKQ